MQKFDDDVIARGTYKVIKIMKKIQGHDGYVLKALTGPIAEFNARRRRLGLPSMGCFIHDGLYKPCRFARNTEGERQGWSVGDVLYMTEDVQGVSHKYIELYPKTVWDAEYEAFLPKAASGVALIY